MVYVQEVERFALNAIAEKQHMWPWLTIDFFVRPWEISGPGKLIELPRSQVDPQRETVMIGSKQMSFHQMRQQKYERIIDETLYIARASEGAISAEWVMDQPIFIRSKYVEELDKEMQERQKLLNKK